jgi:Icc-related predicted phosphoesterase
MITRIVAISDTHHQHRKLKIPECDLLIHAGDSTGRGQSHAVREFAQWLNEQPARHIVATPGNHEVSVEQFWPHSREWYLEECPRMHLLIDETVEIEGLKIHGSPYTPWFLDWAYNRARNLSEAMYRQIPEIKPHWDLIPDKTDILVTHGPPYGILDEVLAVDGTSYPLPRYVGCEELLKAVKRVKPQLHIFGHIHCAHGQKHEDGTSFYNVSVVDEMYTPSNGITLITLP